MYINLGERCQLVAAQIQPVEALETEKRQAHVRKPVALGKQHAKVGKVTDMPAARERERER